MPRAAFLGLVVLLLAPAAGASPRPDHVFTVVPTFAESDDGTIEIGYHHCPLVSVGGAGSCHHVTVGSVRMDGRALYRGEHVAVGACYMASCASEQVELPAILP